MLYKNRHFADLRPNHTTPFGSFRMIRRAQTHCARGVSKSKSARGRISSDSRGRADLVPVVGEVIVVHTDRERAALGRCHLANPGLVQFPAAAPFDENRRADGDVIRSHAAADAIEQVLERLQIVEMARVREVMHLRGRWRARTLSHTPSRRENARGRVARALAMKRLGESRTSTTRARISRLKYVTEMRSPTRSRIERTLASARLRARCATVESRCRLRSGAAALRAASDRFGLWVGLRASR